MKTRILVSTAVLAIATLARAGDYTPIAIDPSSYNQDPVIEAAAPKSVAEPSIVTHTADGGTNKTGNTWYEVGFMTNSTGLPLHNSTFTTNNHTFQMAPDYHGNCVFFVGHQQSTWTPILDPATATLTTPAPFDHLSILNASGNGPCRIGYTLHYQGGATEVGLVPITSYDWFDNSAAGHAVKAYDAFGRTGINGVIPNQGTNAGEIFYGDVAVGDPGTPITSIDFYWWGNGTAQNPWSNGRSFIFGVSGSVDGGTTYSPITVTGYNADGIIEADAPKAVGAGFGSPLTNDNTYCTMTMDGGTSKRGATWMEAGYYTPNPTAGLPAAGATISSATQPSIHYTMPSSYVGNCAVCLASNFPTANVKFQTPAAYGGLSLLLGGANAGSFGTTVRAVTQFADGSSETNFIVGPDWTIRNVPIAYLCFGQSVPGGRGVQNIPDQFPNYFASWFGQFPIRDPRNGGAAYPNVPSVRLFDALIPVTNSSVQITNVVLSITNAGNFTTAISVFAISGNGGSSPLITQPLGIVTDSATGTILRYSTNLNALAAANNITNNAVPMDINFIKGWQGSNTFTLSVSNRLGNAVNYQWKRAPRGGGWRDINFSFDMSTFANVAGPNIAGATSNYLTISNATLADSADYIVIASNPYGSFTSYVATVMVLTTNNSVLLGSANGDTITKYTSDTDSAAPAEYFGAAIDQVAQKWLSRGTGATNNFGGISSGLGNLPFIGPAGYVVTPISGASFVNSIRFFCANDAQGRDPRDYTLEGSNDGTSWTRISGGPLMGTLMLPILRGLTGSATLDAVANPCLEVDFANATSYKSYRVTVTNNIEPYQTPLMQIAEIQLLGTFVPAPPAWVRQPDASTIAYVGTSPTFAAKASGLGSLAPKYQWFKSPSTAIAGATTSLLALSNVQLADSGSSYYCVATNNFGTITSSSGALTVLAAPTQAYPAAVLANNPKAYIRLDEPDNGTGNNGVIAHDYVGGHNGYYSNTVNGVLGYNSTVDPDTAMSVGTSSDQLVNGINDVDFGRAANTPGAAFSVEAWVYGGSQPASNCIVAKGINGILAPGIGTGTEQYALDLVGTFAPTNTFRFVVRGANGQGYQVISAIPPFDTTTGLPTWHHLVGVCDQPNSNVFLYVDGLLAASGSIPPNAGIIAQPLPTTIGSRQSDPTTSYINQWVGTIDDVAIYGAALNGGQILNHFFAGQRPPIITVQPTNQTTPENIIVTFATASYGAGTLSYQWYNSDGNFPTTPVGGQTSPNLSFNTSVSQSGNYYQLKVSNPYGSTTSAVAQLSVVGGLPSFATDIPSSQTFLIGHVIQLHVDVLGTAPFTYRWQKNGVDISEDFRTSGTHTNTLTIGYATNADSGNFQCIVQNGAGTTPSVLDALLVTNVSGNLVTPFNAARNGWFYQLTGTGAGGAGMSNNAVTLTDNVGNTIGATFMSNKIDITSFTAQFVYQLAVGAGNGADGVTFCVQNDPRGVGAIGGGGGSIGYSGITPSVALAMNIYAPNTRGINLLQNGTIPTAGAGAYAPILPVDLGNVANPIQVNVIYSGGIVSATFKDLVTSATFSTNFPINIPSIIGGNQAYVGFTGADGGVFSTQVISNFTMSPPAVRINSQKLGDSLVLTWPASSGAFLKTTSALGNPSIWTLATSPFTVVSNQAHVVVSPLMGNQFYRLEVYP
jgi:Concanavalin A-like lectin/glucanases superfamily/Bacterial lectin/Immunoglobulin I-set domain